MANVKSDLSRVLYDIKHEFIAFSRDTYQWFDRADDGVRVIVLAAFILVLLMLFTHKSTDRRKDSGGLFRQFVGALMLICVFAFCTGWALDSRHDFRIFG